MCCVQHPDRHGILETNTMAEKLLGIPQIEHEERSIEGEEWKILREDGTLMPKNE